MSKWAYVPRISDGVLGRTLISQVNVTYQDQVVYEKFLDIPYGYIEGVNTWPYVEYNLSINFIKRFDSSTFEAKSVMSVGIFEGCVLTRRDATTFAISQGVLFFKSGRKVLSAQVFQLPSGNTEVLLNVFVDETLKIIITKDNISSDSNLLLGQATLDGNNILDIFYRKTDLVSGSIRKFVDFANELGFWSSGVAYNFDPTTGTFGRLGGYVRTMQGDKIRITQLSKVPVTKVYKGDVLGKEFNSFIISDFKERSTQGGGTPLTTGQIVVHFLALDPFTKKTYLFISDYVRSGPDNSITNQSILADFNNAYKGRLFDDFCVLLGAVVVRFSATVLGNISFVPLHRGVSGARGIGTGVYPNPADYPKGGYLRADGTSYKINLFYDGVIYKLAQNTKAAKYVVKFNDSAPENIELAEYGHVGSGVLIAYGFGTVTGAGKYNAYGANFDRTNIMRTYFLNETFTDFDPTLSGFRYDENIVRFLFAIMYKKKLIYSVPRAPFLLKVNSVIPWDYNGRVNSSNDPTSMLSIRVKNNVQPSGFADFASKFNNTDTSFPFKDSVLNAIKSKVVALKGALGGMSVRETWSCIPIITVGEGLYASNSLSFIYTGLIDYDRRSNTPSVYHGIQPNDVLFLNNVDMKIPQLRHFVVLTMFGGPFKPLSADVNQPYKNGKKFEMTITRHKYATTPYTGAPT